MKRVVWILAGAALLGALPLLAQTPTPTPTLTPTTTPTPLTVTANTVYTLCSISGTSGVCGRVRKAASQSTTAAYLFQQTAGVATFDVWVSCDNASGGTSKQQKHRLTYPGESYALRAEEVGPCTIGVTPQWTSGTAVLVASISGDHAMLALPTPSP